MTIDEILCNIARNNALTFTEEEQDAMAEAILALEELKWWRGQDLVRREDVINKVKEYSSNWCGSYEPFDKEEALSILKRIPKAEPKYSGCGHDVFCEKTNCKGCEAEPKENKQ